MLERCQGHTLAKQAALQRLDSAHTEEGTRGPGTKPE